MAKRKSEEPAVAETPTKRTRRKSQKAMANEPEKNESEESEAEESADSDDDMADSEIDDDDEANEVNEPEAAAPIKPRKEKEPKTPKKRRGRPPASAETPPENLPPHEKYFWDNRPGGAKTSNNTLASHLLLNHDEYFQFRQSHTDHHQDEIDYLESLHKSSFDQWQFELESAFNICLYGYGSKQGLMQAFAEHLYDSKAKLDTTPKSKQKKKPNTKGEPKIIIVNGYETTIALKDILSTIASTMFPSHLKIPTLAPALQTLILDTLIDSPLADPIYLLINSLDSAALRRRGTQSTLAALAANPSICLVATCDTPNFPLMWDITLRRQFRFLFHDCTTFASYAQEVDVVETVNELLGRSGRRIGGRDGIGYVLKSLPENARNLYRILVAEQVSAGIEVLDGMAGEDNDDEAEERSARAGAGQGVEYRVLYHKAREELVCSTENQFRTLLKEFHDHQMLESQRDAVGTERLIIPFRQDELESLLDDLVGD